MGLSPWNEWADYIVLVCCWEYCTEIFRMFLESYWKRQINQRTFARSYLLVSCLVCMSYGMSSVSYCLLLEMTVSMSFLPFSRWHHSQKSQHLRRRPIRWYLWMLPVQRYCILIIIGSMHWFYTIRSLGCYLVDSGPHILCRGCDCRSCGFQGTKNGT